LCRLSTEDIGARILNGIFIEFFLPFCNRPEKSVRLASRWLLGKQREPRGEILAPNDSRSNCISGDGAIAGELFA
jgi:hypothetical protein